MNEILTAAEQALSNLWGGNVSLTVSNQFEEHRHVSRLIVQEAPSGSPETVIIKRWRIEGEDERFNSDFSNSDLFNEWMNLEFLANLLGENSLAPHVYDGNRTLGFLSLEDLPGIDLLHSTLFGNDPIAATQALIEYAEMLANLHGKTLGHSDTLSTTRESSAHFNSANFPQFFESSLETLERLGFKLSQAALKDVEQAADILSNPSAFSAFTHGDAVFSNIIEWQGRWRLIDFEGSRFGHALWEGVNPRLYFPTSGLVHVFRIPEPAWRKAEEAYRNTFSKYCPSAFDDAIYSSAITAACAGWTLTWCQGHLSLETAVTSNEPWVNQLRQRILARFDMFILTSKEFQSLNALGEAFEKLTTNLRSQWTPEADHLPFYPAFLK
jgi:hypothetical protein